MRLIDADSVLKGIEELKQSPWFNRGKEIVSGDPGFQHIGYIERKEAVDVVRDLCIRKEPTVGGWISVKDRLPEEKMNPLTQDFQDVICFCDFGGRPKRTDIRVYGFGRRQFEDEPHFWHGPQIMDGVITHWMPLPEPPKEDKRDEERAADD